MGTAMASKLYRGALLTTAVLLFIGCGDARTSSAPTTSSPTTSLPSTTASGTATTKPTPTTTPVATTVAPAPVERMVVATFFSRVGRVEPRQGVDDLCHS